MAEFRNTLCASVERNSTAGQTSMAPANPSTAVTARYSDGASKRVPVQAEFCQVFFQAVSVVGFGLAAARCGKQLAPGIG